MWSEVRDGMQAYEISKSFSARIGWETLAIAVCIGIGTHSLWAGVISFFVALFLWAIPYVGFFMMFAFSGGYAFIAYSLASVVCLPGAICFGIAALVFLSSLGGHIATVGH